MSTLHHRVAELLGESEVTGDQTDLLACVATMDPAEYRRFYMAFCAGDPDIMAAIAAGQAWAPGGRMSQAADGLRKSLDADARKRQSTARVDPRRRDLSRLAFRLLRQGAGSLALSAHLRDANAQFTQPLPADELTQLAVWCARRHLDEKNAK